VLATQQTSLEVVMPELNVINGCIVGSFVILLLSQLGII
jgi:hypothetical protein